MANRIVNTSDNVAIRKAEDSLFSEWSLKRYPFATDGCADPGMFAEARYKIVFALKERNWGHTIEEQRALQSERRVEVVDQRETFDDWWTLMAQWADVLLPENDSTKSWREITNSYTPPADMAVEKRNEWINTRIKKSLGKSACMQLKKSPGGGELNKEDLWSVVSEDKDLIIRQFAIYSPHFIVSCGSNDSWHIFTKLLFPDSVMKQTQNGISYFLALLDGSKHKTAIINFGHPSMRVNGTLWGALAFGLRESLEEIFDQLMTAD